MMRRVLIVALAALAVAGCGRKDAQQQAQQQQQNSPFVQDNAQPALQQQQQAASGGSGSLASCPASLPTRDTVAAGIKNALSAIYGPDEAGAKVSVSALTPSSDCSTVTVAYKTSGTPGTTTMSHDGDAWSVTLYNKQYPVK